MDAALLNDLNNLFYGFLRVSQVLSAFDLNDVSVHLVDATIDCNTLSRGN
jgi:hypothetical protein